MSLGDLVHSVCRENERLAAKREERLRKYVRHEFPCPRYAWAERDKPCTCGLDELLGAEAAETSGAGAPIGGSDEPSSASGRT